MTLSAFALILAVVELLVGLPLLAAPRKTSDWLIRLTREDILYRLVGAFFLAICALALADNASVDWSLAGVIRLSAWLGAIKSLVICWWPAWHSELARWFLATAIRQRTFGAVAVAAGVFFSWASSVL